MLSKTDKGPNVLFMPVCRGKGEMCVCVCGWGGVGGRLAVMSLKNALRALAVKSILNCRNEIIFDTIVFSEAETRSYSRNITVTLSTVFRTGRNEIV